MIGLVSGRANRMRSRWKLLCGVASAAALTGLLIVLAVGPAQRLSIADQVASVAGALLAAAALVVSWQAAVRQPAIDPEVLLGRAGDELARQVRRQWTTEASVRGLLPEPLRVRWSSTGPVATQVAASPAEVVGAAKELRVTRLTAGGDVTELAATWRDRGVRQAVVIGAPGAGKTSLAVLLVCQLSKDRATAGPVPVLLNLSDWDPGEEALNKWLVRRLTAYYPMLADRGRFGPNPARRLLDRDLILPVLDGLDEMAADLRPAAMKAFIEHVTQDRLLVLTCRSVEYQDLVEATGIPLARTAVVEIEPVTAAQAAEYLPAGQREGSRRWIPVTAQLETCPTGVLARTLSTPLMVYLARTMYTPPDTDPTALTTFTDPGSVEEHLLRGYLPAIYTPRTPTDDDDHLPGLRSYRPEQAIRWLTFLARHLQANKTHNLAWWDLVDAIPDVRRFRLIDVLLFYIEFPLLLVVATGRSNGWIVRPHPIRQLQPRKLAHGILLGLIMGSSAGLLNWLMFTLLRSPHAAAIGLGCGLLVGIVILFGVWLGHIDTPPGTLKEEAPLIDPRSTLREDRTSFLIVTLISGFAFGSAFSFAFSLSTGLVVGPLAGLTAGYAFGPQLGLGGGWLSLGIARISLAMRGHLPWRLMRFLDDAYHRGALRQTGAEYQFRHARLQDHLAPTTHNDQP